MLRCTLDAMVTTTLFGNSVNLKENTQYNLSILKQKAGGKLLQVLRFWVILSLDYIKTDDGRAPQKISMW